MFFGSAALGTLTGLISALVSSRHSPCMCLYFICVRIVFSGLALFQFPNLLNQFLKHFDLRNTPSLEFGMMIIFAYLPYGLAEGIKLSGGSIQSHAHNEYMNSFVCLTFPLTSISHLFPPTGIMSILFAGIVMSHYTHHNLSPVTQILMQQTLRTVAFMCGQ